MVKFGLVVENFTSPGKDPDFDAILRQTRRAEELGFDSIWVYDHLVLGSKKVFPILESLTTISALAAGTSRIKFGTSILVLPLREPLLLAKVVSTINHISKGRLILGVAAGWYEKEFKACGISFLDRGRIMEEKFLLLKRLLTEDDINVQGSGYEYKHTTIAPRPSRENRIRMLMGGYVERVLKRVGTISDGWLSYYYTAKDFSESWNRVIGYAKAAGRNPSELSSANMLPISVASNSEEANQKIQQFTQQYMDLPSWSHASVDSGIAGNLDDCEKTLRSHVEAGVDNIVFIPAFYDQDQVEVIGGELLPRFLAK
jgi:alkanesulfonate monooxygenase